MIKWRWRPFEGLTTRDLYAIFELRIEVFTVEQNCVYQDADGKDFKAWHLLGWEDDVLIAYIRLLPAGVSYDIPSLGRVATKAIARGRGLGKLIMQKALEKSDELWPGQAMRISAQAYLRKFYEDLGFSVIGEPYLEDDIPHFAMIRDV